MTTDQMLNRPTRRAWLTALLAGLGTHCSLSVADVPAVQPVVLVLGDSLSAEYGLARGTGWVALLAERLAKERPKLIVVNASISGETTAGGRSRLPALLARHHPAVVVVELGANDGLRGLSLAMTREHLSVMTRDAQAAGAKVLLVGMQVPPNYGKSYNEELARSFVDVAKAQQAALLPFLLKGVADAPDAEQLFQADRLHPLAKAHPTILAHVWPALLPLLPR